MIKKLEGLSKEKLLAMARKLGIPKISGLTTTKLISLIEKSSRTKKQKVKIRRTIRRAPHAPQLRYPFSVRVKLKPGLSEEKRGVFVHPSSESVIPRQKEIPSPVFSTYELPRSYGETKIVLMVRDPYWCFVYWDFSIQTERQVSGWFHQWPGSRAVLRVYDVTDIEFDGRNANGFFDLDIHFDARNWYLEVGRADRSFVVDIGVLDSEGRFHLIARSNAVRTPRDMPSEIVDEAWMNQEFELFYALSGGFKIGSSSAELIEMVRKGELFRKWISSGAVSSRTS